MTTFTAYLCDDQSHATAKLIANARQVASSILTSMKAAGATEEQQIGLKALFGMSRSLGAPRASNVPLSAYACDQLSTYLKRLDLTASPDAVAIQIRSTEDPEVRSRLLDMRAFKRSIMPQLKREWLNAFVVLRPCSAGDGLGIAARAICYGLREQGSRPGGPRRVARLYPVPETDRWPLGEQENRIAAAAAALFCSEGTELPSAPGAKGEKARRLDAALVSDEQRLMLARAQIDWPRAMFGFGTGKKVAKCLSAELAARAAGLDVAAKAPIQIEGVPAFLAGLGDGHGGSVDLPVIRTL